MLIGYAYFKSQRVDHPILSAIGWPFVGTVLLIGALSNRDSSIRRTIDSRGRGIASSSQASSAQPAATRDKPFGTPTSPAATVPPPPPVEPSEAVGAAPVAPVDGPIKRPKYGVIHSDDE